MAGKRSHVFSGSVYEEMAGYARAVVVDDRILGIIYESHIVASH